MPTVYQVLEKAQTLHVKGELDEAQRLYEAVLGKAPRDSYLLYSLGTLYSQKGAFGTAMALLMRAVDEMPEPKEIDGVMRAPDWHAQTWMNLGVCYKREGHDQEAEQCYIKSLEINPKQIESLANLSGLYVNRGEPEKGLEWAEKALAIEPNNAQAAHHKGLLLLEAEKWEEGWKWHENRCRIAEYNPRNFSGNKWHGQKVKQLVIHGEQGIGDEIMFASMIKAVQAKGLAEKIIIEPTPRLETIFRRSFGQEAGCSVDVIPYPEEIKRRYKVKHWIALASLPYALGMRGPITHEGYIKPDEDKVAKWKEKFPGFRVGFSWRGGTKNTHEHLRNFPIEWWFPLTKEMKKEGMRFISLQYGQWDKEREAAGLELAEWEDFDDHLALVAACDIVITVCNTTVHMAGSMNIPCFTLVPYGAAWRYGTKSKRMVWYPSVKLCRQEKDESRAWHDTIRSIAADFTRLSGNEPPFAPRDEILRNIRAEVGEGGDRLDEPDWITNPVGLRGGQEDAIPHHSEVEAGSSGYRLRPVHTGARPQEIV